MLGCWYNKLIILESLVSRLSSIIVLLVSKYSPSWTFLTALQEVMSNINPKIIDIFVRVLVKLLYLLSSKIRDFG